MGKQILKRAGTAATESVFRDLMPFLDERFSSLQADVRMLGSKIDEVDRRLDAKIDALRDEMLDRFERQLDTINEVSHRITKLDGRVEGFMELFGKMFEPVRIPTRKRRAG